MHSYVLQLGQPALDINEKFAQPQHGLLHLDYEQHTC